ncbi:MAG: hypothetical protein ACC645_09315 [Pirellulales bacterium]
MKVRRVVFLCVAAYLLLGPATVGRTDPPIEIDRRASFHVELPAGSPTGEASIREHTIAWHPHKEKYDLVAGGMRIAHLVSDRPNGPFQASDPRRRYLPPDAQLHARPSESKRRRTSTGGFVPGRADQGQEFGRPTESADRVGHGTA